MAVKRNKVLIPAATELGLENMLSKQSQSPRIITMWVCLYEINRIGKSMEKKSRPVVAQGWGIGRKW